jgi:hypothetical protein
MSLMAPGAADAVIHPARVLDGPANDILDVDGSAMAPDGSGAVVYRKDINGVPHVFADQFLNGAWAPPVQVDAGNPFGASQPTIAAGSGGRLLVVWVQPRNVNHREITEYELVGASLQPGASAFGEAVAIDPSVGEPYTGDVSAVAPRLAMASNGAAYVVYRVVSDDCGLGDELNPEEPKCRTGSTDKVVQVRVARYNYLRWSSLGAVNRASQVAMRNPTPSNAPAIGADVNGNGVVAWQEPGSDGVARIWVRRLFGNVLGNVLEASPETAEGRPVTSDADAPAVAESSYGEARIAYRVQGAPGSAISTPELFVTSISSSLGLKASQLTSPVPLPGATQSDVGAPSAAIDLRGDFRLAWMQGAAARELSGTDEGLGSQVVIAPGSTAQALTAINPAGGGTTAWPAAPAGLPVVDVREDYAQGAFQLAQLAGGIPGPVEGLSLGGSGQGDALLGWMQGPVGQSEVVGDFVQAPPAPFTVDAPSTWVRASATSISWEASPDAVAGVLYTVYVDGKPRLRGLAGLTARLSSAALGDGVHRVQVMAADGSGQQTMSPARALKVDANPPTVSLAAIRHGRGVRVTIRDRASGVDARALRISFGDGTRAAGRAVASHEYRHPGAYPITVLVRDKVGNHATVRLRVRAR